MSTWRAVGVRTCAQRVCADAVCAQRTRGCGAGRVHVCRTCGWMQEVGCALMEHACGACTWLRPGAEPPSPRVVRPQQAAGLRWDGPQTVPRVLAPAPRPARALAQGPTCAA